MTITRLLAQCEVAGIGSDRPTSPGDSYSNAWVDYWGATHYALVKFAELAEVPANATIQLARLRWKMFNATDPQYNRAGTSPLTLRANRITSAWTPSTVTWNAKPTFDTVSAPSITDAFNQPGQWTPWWDVTSQVAGMVAGTYPKNGWLMECLTYGGGVAFYNSVNISAELEVTYISPAGATTDSPSGSQSVPAVITDKVSGFNLVAGFESSGGEPLSSITAQLFDKDSNLLREDAKVYNALTGNQQSVETDATGFTAAAGAVLARDLTRAWHGNASLKVTPAAAAGSGVRIPYTTPQVGKSYSGRTMVSGPVGKALELQIQAVDAAGAVLNAKSLTRTILGNTMLTGAQLPEAKNWVECAVSDVYAGTGATEVRVEVKTTDTSAPVFYLDGNVLNQGSEVSPWISQDQVDFSVPANLLKYGPVNSWRVKASNSAGSSGWSPLAYFKCVLSAIAGLTASGISSEALIRPLWNAHPGENLAGYRVYRALTGKSVALHSIDLVSAEKFDDDAAQTGITYDYQVAPVAADGYEGPKSTLVTAAVTFDGYWLAGLQVYPSAFPQIDRGRLASHRVALDGSLVSQDYGVGPRSFYVPLTYRTKAEKDAILDALARVGILAYRDNRGEVFRGRLNGNVDDRPYAVYSAVAGVLGVRLVEVTPK